MNVVRYDPWSVLSDVREHLNKLYGLAGEGEVDQSNVVTSEWQPSVDIREEPERFVLLADVPGVDPKDIEITMENGVLTVKGERKLEREDTKEGYSRIERAHGVFYRRFTLPDTADPEAIEARGDNGVLTIVIPKKPVAQPRRIEVTN